MSKNKQKSSGLDSGMFFVPVIEAINDLVFWLINTGIEKGSNWLVKKTNGNNLTDIKKIEKNSLSNKKTTGKFNSIGYSITRKKEFLGGELNKKMHAVVIGASGSGKSVLLESLMFDDMRDGKGVIYVDPKADAETRMRFISLCRLSNRDYEIFSEDFEGKNKLRLNCAKEGSYTQIADRVFKSFIWSEEHYANKSYQGLKLAIKILKEAKAIVNLESILFKLIELTKLPKEDENYLDKDKIDGVITKLSNIVDTDFKDLLKGEDSKGFSELRSSGKCIYIGLPVQGYAETAKALGKLLLGDVNYSVYKTYRSFNSKSKVPLKPVALYVDELSAFITDEYIQILNKCRGAKLEITSAFQTPSDINKLDPETCQQLMENSLNWFIMKQRMQKSAEDICNSIGTVESTKDTVRIEDGRELSAGSQRKVEELIVHPNVVKNLNQGQCILLRQQPTRIDLINVRYIDQSSIDSNLNYFEAYGLIRKDKKKEQTIRINRKNKMKVEKSKK